MRARHGWAALGSAGSVDELAVSEITADDLIEVVPSLTLAALDTPRLATLTWLLDRFPFADDPPTRFDGWANPQSGTRRACIAVLMLLAERGLLSALYRLAEGRSQADREVIGWYRRAARSHAADAVSRIPLPTRS